MPSADVENKSTTYVCTSLCSLAAAGSLKFLSLKTSPEQNSSAWETRPALQATDKSAVATRDPWQSVELGWQQITGVLAARHPSLAPFFTVAASEGDQQRCATPKTFKLLETMWPQNGRRPAGPMSHTEALETYRQAFGHRPPVVPSPRHHQSAGADSMREPIWPVQWLHQLVHSARGQGSRLETNILQRVDGGNVSTAIMWV